jgi:DNA-binding transcriptional MocR family regulator
MITALAREMPEGTSWNEPDGGYFLWVELPGQISALALQARALDANIAIAPGPIFGARARFSSCIRMTCGSPWSPRIADAVKKLGELSHELARSPK